MASQPMVLKLKPVQTKKVVAAPSPVTFEPMSKRTSTKYDDNKIAERIQIEKVIQSIYRTPNVRYSFRTIRQSLTKYFSWNRGNTNFQFGRYARGNASTKTSTWPFVERPKDASTKIKKSSSSTKCSWQEKNWIWKFEAWKWETFATGAQATDWKSSKRGNFFTYIPLSNVKYLFIDSKHHTYFSFRMN